MTATFYAETDYQCSSGPYINRKAVTDDLWPEGAQSGSGTKDTLTDGEHPFLAVGPRTQRPHNVVGVVLTYKSETDMATLNVAPGFIARNYIANITGYAAGAANAWAATLDKHVPVWVDDSDDLAEGVTLSRSPANDAAADNPLAGYTWPAQDEWDDSGVAGGNSDPFPKAFSSGVATAYLTQCVMLWPNNED